MDVEFLRHVSFRWVTFAEAKATVPGVLAKRDGLAFKDTNNTEWIVMEHDGEDVGVMGLLRVNKGGVVRIKAVFVCPEWRRMGLQSYATLFMARHAMRTGAKKIIGVARPASKAAMLAMGASQTPDAKPSAVEYELADVRFLDDSISDIELTVMLRNEARGG